MTNGVVDFVLMWLEVAVLVHDLAEDVPVGQGGSFGKEQFVLLFFGGLLP